jgi:hypothetical protein
MKEIIFKVEYGGLGDHLFYSALPRLLKENCLADKVYLSDQSSFRNPQIFDMIWKNNPYLDGITNKEPTPAPEILRSKQKKVVNLILERYGITSSQEIPVEIYPKLEPDLALQDKYIDLNYVSYVGAFSWLDKLKLYRNYPDHIIINPDKLAVLLFPERKKIFPKSLLEYAYLINAASSFVTLASGGATLAAGLNKSSIIYFGHGQDPIFHHGIHQYIQVGGNHILRRKLSRFYKKRNERRVLRDKNK